MGFLKALEERILVIDGAMGTLLIERGLRKGECPDSLNLTRPEIVLSVHKDYADAGADIVETNTFGANRLKLGYYGLEGQTEEINRKGVEIARKSGAQFVAASIGPIGKYVEPLGDLTFEKAYETYAEQAGALKKADVINLETFSDIKLLKAAVLAAKDNTKLPVCCMLSFEGERTDTGTDVETAVSILNSLDVDIIGANCGLGYSEVYKIFHTIAKNTDKPIIIMPNAGMPKFENGQTCFDFTQDSIIHYAKKFAEEGANIIGGCCGTTPGHIRAIAKAVKVTPKKREYAPKTRLCSRTRTTRFDTPLIIGERINPTGRPELARELIAGETRLAIEEAVKQAEAGAGAIDLNVGHPEVDEPRMLRKLTSAVQNAVDLPLVIDSSNQKAIEEALKSSDGKVLINSVNGDERTLETILPLAKRYGAAVLGLALDRKGIPKTAQGRIEIAKKIIAKAQEHGIKKEDLFIDAVTLTIATNPDNAKITLETIKELKKLGVSTVLGVSNISHGLPNRPEINASFLSLALSAGLDAPIANPLEQRANSAVKLHGILLKGTGLDGYLKQAKQEPAQEQSAQAGDPEKLAQSILIGDEENIVQRVEACLKTKKPLEISSLLAEALQKVGERYEKKELFLPHLLLSASAAKKAFARLSREFKSNENKPKGTILLASVEGDIHDIGKNIVKTLLESHGWKAIDLGSDVPAEKILQKAKELRPDAVALSSLMTTTMPEMKKITALLKKQKIDIPVLVGGAVVTEKFAADAGASYAQNAVSAVKKVEELLGDQKPAPAPFTQEPLTPESNGCGICPACLTPHTGKCPLTACTKGLLNGPCGGSSLGKCEADSGRDCGWAIIYTNLKNKKKLGLLAEYKKPKNFAGRK